MDNTPLPADNGAFQFTARLLAALSKPGKRLPELVDIAHDIFENPIMIADKSWRAVLMMPRDEIPGDKSWNEFLTYGFLSTDAIVSSIEGGLVEKIDKSKKPFAWLGPDMKYRRLIGKINLSNSTATLISIAEYNRAFCDSDFELMELFCNAVASELQKSEYQKRTRGTQDDDFYISLLDRRLNDPVKISDMLKVLNIRLKRFKYVLVLDISETISNQISAVYLREHVEKTISGCKALIYDGRVVCITSFPAEGGIDIATDDLDVLLKKFKLQCGISRCFEQLAALRVHYEQALNALRTGQHMAPDQQVFRYSVIALQHVAAIVWDSGGAEGFIHPGLQALVEFDEVHHTDFVMTLTAYLRNFGNITNMSKVLNMHRNTSIYRMSRISEITGVSLTDYDMMEQIAFSLMLLDYKKNGRAERPS